MNPIVITTLETERLILRPPTLSDAEAIERFVSDRRVAEATALIPHPYPPGGGSEWVVRAERAWQEGSDRRLHDLPARRWRTGRGDRPGENA